MKKLFHFDAPREKYHCDATIKIAGGAKVLASPGHESDREFDPDQIRKFIRWQSTKRVILMLPSDCGAYGGLAAGFHDDADAEAVHHEPELHRAAANLRTATPGVEVQGYFVNFEGIWNAEIGIGNGFQEATAA
jgi:hypothetical protein